MLEEYKRKRDFGITPEPSAHEAAQDGDLKFVIQKHSARRLHYDFRLELDGVLLSWAVPKGPSLNPEEKHLAVQTEDHPLDYANFEGNIPKGEYGGGPVIIWDKGTFSPDNHGDTSWGNRAEAQKRIREGLKKGKISIFLKGEKLQGSWTLFRLANKEKDWILLKHKDQFVKRDVDITHEDRSVVSGLTIEEMSEGKQAAQPKPDLNALEGAKTEKLPSSFTPMFATLAKDPFDAPGWVYEPKLDGIRAVATIKNGKVTLLSRRGLDLSAAYPSIVKQLSNLQMDMMLDGEIVALDAKGRPSFQLLQQRSGLSRDADVRSAETTVPVFYYVFDLLYLGNKSLLKVPLADRKTLLHQSFITSEPVRLVENLAADGILAFDACLAGGLEGVVAKRSDSVYEPGKRSRAWMKVKATLSSDLVICGYTQGAGSRNSTFGAIILGYNNDKGNLVYAGGCGTGFNEKTLAVLQKKFADLETKDCPFTKKPPGKRFHWLKPELVAEVKFAELTNDNILRSPVFMRLRNDKTPEDCTMADINRDITKEERIEDSKQTAKDAMNSQTSNTPQSQPKDSGKEQRSHAEVISLDNRRLEKQSGNKDVPTQKSKMKTYPVEKAVIEALENAGDKKLTLEVEGHTIAFSNLDKEFWPATESQSAITKRDYALYLCKVAPWLIPHTTDRPITLLRYPNGIGGTKFYQKHWDKNLPAFVQTVLLYGESAGANQRYLSCNNLATLLWLAQIADLELHTWQSRTKSGPDAHDKHTDFAGSVEQLEASLLNYPDYLLFDLDPYIYSGKEKRGEEPGLHLTGFKQTAALAKWLKEILDTLEISSFIKTTGKTGLHLYIPIVREFTFDEVRAISETIGRAVLAQHPNDVTMEWAVVKRTGKIFLDHNMNGRGKTLASIYSPRVSPEGAVSTPIAWDEIDDVYPTDFTMHTVPGLLEKRGDLWADILNNKNDLRKILERNNVQPAEVPKRKRRKTS